MASKALNVAKQVGNYLVAQYKHHKTDAYIISYPKSGRTWLRILIGKILCEKFNLPDEIMLDTYKITTAAPGIFRTQLTHDHSSMNEGLRYFELPTDKRKYASKKVILLTRNIKDVLVSCYFQATKRIGKYNGNISEFIRSDRYGARKIITFYNTWYQNREVPKEFLHMKYEDMHNKPEEALSQTMRFLGLHQVGEKLIRDAIQFASFDNMKVMEKEFMFKERSMRPANVSDDESFKVRKGMVGGYTSYLSPNDIDFIDKVKLEMGYPFE